MAEPARQLRPVANETPTLRLNLALEEIAERVGALVQHRRVVRVPAKFRLDLEWYIQNQGLTGTLRLEFSQGTVGWVVWEENR